MFGETNSVICEGDGKHTIGQPPTRGAFKIPEELKSKQIKTNQKSKIKNQKSKIKNRKSKIVNLKS
jgi:hypothetical protein